MQNSLTSSKGNKFTGDPRANMSTNDEVMNMYYDNDSEFNDYLVTNQQTTTGTERHQA